MQLTGHAGKHLSQPLHSSGMITTSAPWLKMAPNWGGQWRLDAGGAGGGHLGSLPPH